MSDSWSFAQIWNSALDVDNQREYVPRDYVWASELGRGYYDRYWKMKGRKPTTPPNVRARRKFEGGNLTEWIMQQVLARAGILQSSQDHIVFDEGAIKVTGRCDFTAGGQVLPLDAADIVGPDTFAAIASTTIDRLMDKYPDGLREVGIELKSCSGIMFDRYEASPGYHHALQAYHYAHKTERPYLLVYISRDDLRVCEWLIMPDDQKWGELYMADLEAMAKVFALPEDQVQKEPLLLFENEKFKKNFEVEYSSYLTDYGFERPDEYADAAKVAVRLNNVIKRIVAGAKMTKINEEALALGVKFYPEVEEIINNLKEKYGNTEKS